MTRFSKSDGGSSRERSPRRSSGRDTFTKFEDRDTSRGRPRSGGRDSGRSYGGRDSGRSFGGRSSGGREGGRGFGGRGNSDLEMHRITCDECGRQSEVPFKPTSSKPVYCSDCFKKHDNKGGSGSRDGGRSNGGSSRTLDEINSKLDKIMKAMDLN
jgi:CxxC-x17-CxxC domain-containing protein